MADLVEIRDELGELPRSHEVANAGRDTLGGAASLEGANLSGANLHGTSLESYKRWTSAFAADSHLEGSWEQGARIRFLAPSGDGMVAEIAVNRESEFISIRHLDLFANGVEDTTSEAGRAWAPASLER